MKLVRLATTIAAGAFALASVPAAAQSTNDVRCLVVSTVFTNMTKDENLKRTAQLSSAFYLGRLDRFSTTQLKTAVDREKKALNGVQLGPIMNGCAQALVTSGKMINGVLQQATPAPAAK